MSYKELPYNEVNFTRWVIGEPRRNTNGSTSLRIKDAPHMIFPVLQTPFGIQEPKSDEEEKYVNVNTTRRNLTLNVSDPNVANWLSALDEHFISWVTENSASVFNRVIKRSTVEDVIYYRALKPAKKEYSPTFKVKINTEGQYRTEVYVNEAGTTTIFPGTYDEVTRQSEVMVTVEASSLWANTNQIGITFNVRKLLVFKPAQVAGNPFPGFQLVPRPGDNGAAAASQDQSQAGTNGAADASTGSNNADKFDFGDDDPTNMY